MAGIFEQFVAFGTDIVGLERLMRLLQSIFTILTSYPTVIPMLLPTQTKDVHQRSELAMLELSARLNLTRRSLRLFWCLGSFQSSFSAFASGPSEKSIDTWLSITADSLFGLFGLLESLTLPDLLQTRHFSVLGHAEAVKLDQQAQGLWLAALSCAILSSAVRLAREMSARRAAPRAQGCVSGAEGKEKDVNTTTTTTHDGGVRGVGARKRDHEALDKARGCKISGLARKLAAEMLDIVIPAWSTGLADIELGTVAVAMFWSTVLTSYAVWERCGLVIDGKRCLDHVGG
ncbi:hypothetical protein E4U21_003706 [Claviceps maximensis]|nr:hypothetical protein E4U21_003706 [Claviceps maximensis]